MRKTWTFRLALLLPLLLPAAALARDPGGVFQVSTDRFGDASSAAMDDDGGFLVSWVSDGSDISARRYDPAGAPLTGEFEVGQVTATYSGGTAATLDRSGFLVVWGNEPKYFGSYLLGQRFDRENHPLLSEPFDLAGAWDFDVASDPKGTSVVVGMDANRIVATRRNAAGQPVGGKIEVTGNGLYPEVTVDAAGHFVAAWQREGQGIFVRRFSASGSPRGQAVKVTANVAPPSLAGNRQGQFVVAWKTGSALWARFYSASGEPRTKPVLVSNEVGEYTSLSAAMDAEGKVLVTWTCCSDLRNSVLNGRWFDRTGAPSGDAFRISSGPYTFSPAAASGPANRFLVVWTGKPLDPTSLAEYAVLGRRLAFARPGDDPCLLRRGNFVCDTAHDGGEEELLISFRGPGSDVPLFGDLDGDGDDDPCRYRPGRFLCDVAHDGGTPELEIAFGLPGDIPLLGDLDGEGKDDVCVYRGTEFLCDTAHNGGTAEVVVSFNPFGHPLVLPFLADVDGDGDDDPCLARNGQLLCDREHDGGPEDLAIPVDFGAQGDVLLLGDVNNDNRADPCVHRNGRFLCDTRRDGSADLIIPFNFRGAIPLLGNPDGL